MIFDIIPKGGLPTHPNLDSKEFTDFLKKNEGKLCTLELKVVRNSKSNQQNRYFRGVLLHHFQKALYEAGYNEITTPEAALRVMKHFFFKFETKVGKEIIVDYLSTSNKDWNTEDWENKMSEIRNWVYDKLNYIIPLPNESIYNFSE